MEVKEYKEEEYRTIFGVTKNTFEEMIAEVEKNITRFIKKGPKRWTKS